ncbi:MAG: hypothetical protein ABSE62_10365 [Chthoniobacteraceae bacterium]|jgi:Tfp pilus assembly protein PilE
MFEILLAIAIVGVVAAIVLNAISHGKLEAKAEAAVSDLEDNVAEEFERIEARFEKHAAVPSAPPPTVVLHVNTVPVAAPAEVAALIAAATVPVAAPVANAPISTAAPVATPAPVV